MVRDKKRIKKILKEIEKIWNNAPDMRFGQLLINIGLVPDDMYTWNVEDEPDLLNQLKRINNGRREI